MFTLLRNFWALLLWPLRAATRLIRRPHTAAFVRLELSGPLTILPAVGPWWKRRWQARNGQQLDLMHLERLFQTLGGDANVRGLLLQVSQLHAGWAATGALLRLLTKLRSEGKEIVIYLPAGAGEKELYLSSAASRVYLSPGASVSVAGFSREVSYLKGLLDHVGVVAQVDAQGDFKTAAEPLVQAEMSPSQRKQLGVLLAARQRLLADALGPRLNDGESVAGLMREVALSSERAIESGLVDGFCYEDGLPGAVGAREEGKKKQRWAVDARRYWARRPRTVWRRVRAFPEIVVLPLGGAIRDSAGPLSRGGTLLRPTIAALRALRDDKHVAGVVLLVNSPGGSALVSDLLHHEVERLTAEKPVVTYFADVAASGGYYIAAPSSEIVAAPEAITGSIGVISMKLSAAKLLTRLGVSMQAVQTAPHATMMSIGRELSSDELAVLRAESSRIYGRFLDVVARGRKLEIADVTPLAGGRVWSAQDALCHKLVDQIGDLSDAVDAIRRRIDRPNAQEFPVRRYRDQPVGVLAPERAPSSSEAALAALAELGGAGNVLEGMELAASTERTFCYWPLGTSHSPEAVS